MWEFWGRCFFVCLFILTACSPFPNPSPSPLPPTRTRIPFTVTPPDRSIEPTFLATRTPLATLIPTRTPTGTVDVAATAGAFFQTSEPVDDDQIKKELAALGLPLEGSLAWYDPGPIEITLKNYNETKYSAAAQDLILTDFILRVAIGWSSKTGLAGCGIILRADPPLGTGKQYQFSTLRLAGAPAWDLEYFSNGQLVPERSLEVQYTKLIDIEQGATNLYHLMVQGKELTVFANGTRLGTFSLSDQEKGLAGVMGFQESGETTCLFSQLWIWEIPGKN